MATPELAGFLSVNGRDLEFPRRGHPSFRDLSSLKAELMGFFDDKSRVFEFLCCLHPSLQVFSGDNIRVFGVVTCCTFGNCESRFRFVIGHCYS